MATSKPIRITPELYNFLNIRAKKFKSNMTAEQRNLMAILGEMENKLGVDFKNVPVNKPSISSKKKVWVLKW